jgi:hypothetical protein
LSARFPSKQVYRILRASLDPWCKTEGFRRGQAFLSWYQERGSAFLAFWCQCSQDGWDDFAGSKFVVELQIGDSPEVGAPGVRRSRLAEVLTTEELEEVRQIQNEVISQLPRPPRNHSALQDPRLRDWYLRKFDPVNQPYRSTHDVWLRYGKPEDVERWGAFLRSKLPFALLRFVG